MNNEFGLRELYDLTLKATYPMEIGGRIFETGEVVARFDKIQISNFQEITDRASAHGGYDNRDLVFWEDPKEIRLNFIQGIFSKQQFALLCNSRLIRVDAPSNLFLSNYYDGESDENCKILLDKQNIQNVFVYDKKTSEKIVPLSIDKEKGEITISKPYQEVLVNFDYLYQNEVQIVRLGEKVQGYLSLEGKTRVKDDITGKTRTAILQIPRLKLMSDLSMRLGREANPMSANFTAIGVPEGGKGSKRIMDLYFLSDDIDAEI